MNRDSLAARLRVPAEYPEPPKKTDRKPKFIFFHVEIDVRAEENGEQKKEYSEEKRVNEKFAHILNMSER